MPQDPNTTERASTEYLIRRSRSTPVPKAASRRSMGNSTAA
jgi:hypothetical protein